MSDTKQQCPTCEKWRQVSGLSTPEELDKIMDNVLAKNLAPIRPLLDALTDSPVEGSAPSAAGSGAREWLINGGGGHEDGEDGIRATTLSMDAAIELMNDYADHCTAQLRGEDKYYDALAHESFLESLGCVKEQVGPHEWHWRNDRAEKAEADLTAERTRREAAERELKELREALQGASSYIEFYAEREMKSPSNNSEAVRETREMLTKVRAALRGKGE